MSDIRTNPANPVVAAAKLNDLLDWSPKSSVLLCGGAEDPTVPPVVHQQVMKAAFDAKGLKNVTSVDVDPLISATYGAIKSSNPVTYYSNYHGTYEPPFCHAQAKALFDKVK